MGNNGGESGKAQAVVDDERGGEEDGGVVTVLLYIEETIRNDLESIVWDTGIRISLDGGDREVGSVPSVGEIEDWDDDPEPEEERNHGVHLGPPLKGAVRNALSANCTKLTGMTKGLPKYEIIAQSKVMNPIPKPEA